MMQVNHDSNCYFYVSEYNNVRGFSFKYFIELFDMLHSFPFHAPIQLPTKRQKISITALHDTYARLKFSNSIFWTLI